MMQMSSSPLTATPVPALIVLGRDDGGKNHASWFDDGEATLARKAAALMGMTALAINNDPLRELATRLPHGRVFGSGKAFVPFVKADTYNQIASHLSASEKERLQSKPETGDGADDAAVVEAEVPTNVPADFRKIKAGSVVLAWSNEDEGWWEAVVLKVASENLFTLRWRDYPDQEHFIRSRKHIGLLHPDVAGQ